MVTRISRIGRQKAEPIEAAREASERADLRAMAEEAMREVRECLMANLVALEPRHREVVRALHGC